MNREQYEEGRNVVVSAIQAAGLGSDPKVLRWMNGVDALMTAYERFCNGDLDTGDGSGGEPVSLGEIVRSAA